MGCMGDEEEDAKEGLVVKRSCRDVLCLLFFAAFWAGMFVICAFAFKEGQPNRLIYGIDSYGMTCGEENTLFNITFDLRDSKNLYYLNPLQLLDPMELLYARKVCSSSCPGAERVCNQANLPCTNNTQYVCPYYFFSEEGLYDRIPGGVDPASTSYYEAMGGVTNVTAGSGAADFIARISALGGWYAEQAASLESGLSGKYYQLMSQLPGQGPCYPVLIETAELFYRCVPKFPPNTTKEFVDAALDAAGEVLNLSTFSEWWNSSAQKWGRYVGDISKGVLVIVIGGLVSGLVMSLIWLLILRYLGGFMVWIAIVFINLCMIAACLYTWVKAGYIGDQPVASSVLDALPVDINPAESEQKTWFWIAVGTSVAAGIVLLVTLLCITRVKIAVACVKCASQAVGHMPSMIFFPILPFIFVVGLVLYWVAVTALLYSAGDLTANCRTPVVPTQLTWGDFKDAAVAASSTASDPTSAFLNYTGLDGSSAVPTANVTNCYQNVTLEERAYLCGADPDCYLTYNWNNKLKYAFIYHFFGLLWTNQVIIGFTQVTIAGAVAAWYWSRGGAGDTMPAFPVLVSLKNTVVYHMGSICFGGFIIAIIQLIRALLEYLDQKTKELQAANKFAEWAMCCVKCCMWCLEKIVQFINRNAFIMVAIKGKGYCCSAASAVKLIVANALRISVVNLVATVLIFLAKVAVAALCGVIAYAMTTAEYYTDPTKYPDTFLYSPVLVIAISVIVGYAVADIFFAVYEMTIDTIILAFCEDCDKNSGNPKYAPQLLMDVMGQADAASKPAKG